MRIVIGGDRLWNCRDLAADVLRRLPGFEDGHHGLSR
jgi:hypothetical protein